MTLEITASNFEEVVLKSDIPVLVDFWAPWCGPCKLVAPIIDELAETFDGRYKVGKINMDKEQSLASKFGIMSIPTLMVFNNGELVKKQIGFTSKEALLKLFE
ncbi:MAG: thioredoxin [Oscillospiraceae bacterium]